MRRIVLVTRWWWHLAARPLRDHLVPRGMAWLLLLVQLDAMVDMVATSRRLMAQPAWVAAAALGGLTALHAVSERGGVAAGLLHPRFAVLRRQPLGRGALGVPGCLVVVALCLPLALLGWLWSRSVGVGLLWAVAAVPAVAFGGAGRWGRAAVGVAWAAGWAAAAQALPASASWLLTVGAAFVAVPVVGDTLIRWPVPPGSVPRGLRWRPGSALVALVQRDLLVLWRTDRSGLGTAMLAAPVVVAMVWAARVNGAYAGGALVTGIALAMAFLAPLALSVAAGVARGLGAQFDPPSVPVRPLRRLAASVRQIGRGDWEARLEVGAKPERDDEAGRLAREVGALERAVRTRGGVDLLLDATVDVQVVLVQAGLGVAPATEGELHLGALVEAEGTELEQIIGRLRDR